MAFMLLSISIPDPMPPAVLFPSSASATSTASTSFAASYSMSSSLVPPPANGLLRTRAEKLTRGRRKSWIVRMAPEEEKMTRRSPLDFPIEWERPKPGRRPDIMPQFSPMKTPLPPPMPADPPPEEDEEEEEEEKKEEEEEDPNKEDPEKKNP
ncbi:uncharacterized protein LOC127262950 [Andrographis paniculata]|uniref:uncharacterized protein LOC127262950 n=1 Tax=Andrographis paniculata TaxID=175694 RepID=UPI0021E7CEFA|nr:uncharacterized protein LOC127262950 [Andrographis paniculata]